MQMQTSVNSPRKNKDQVTKLQNEINSLKNTIKQQNECIQGLEKELSALKTTQTESNEYEEYAKKQLLRNVEILSNENNQLREEIEKYKNKVVKMMKLLYNMSKKGISVDVMVDCAEEDINDNNNNDNNNTNTNNTNADMNTNKNGDDDIQLLETQMSNLSSTTFTPLNLPDDENVNNIVCHTQLPSNGVVPKLNLEQFNKTKYNENYSTSANKPTNNNNNNNNNSHDLLLDMYTIGNHGVNNTLNIMNNHSVNLKKNSNNSFNGSKQLNKSVNLVNSNNNNNKIKLMNLNGAHFHNNNNINQNNSNSGSHQRHDSSKNNSSKSGGNNKNK